MAGKKLGTPPGGAVVQAVAAARQEATASTTPRSTILNIAPNLQEQMLLQGQVDVIAIFTATSYMNLVALKLDPGQGLPLDLLRRFRPRSLFQRRHGVAEARQGEARGGQGSGAGHRQVDARGDGQSRCGDRPARRARSRCSTRTSRSGACSTSTKTLIATPEASELGVGDIKDARMADAIDGDRHVLRAAAQAGGGATCSTARSCRRRPSAR